MPRSGAVPQLAFDETLVEDPTLESALEQRLAAKVALNEVRKKYDEAHAVAAGEIEKMELPEGRAARVGRFRITRSAIPARSVEFEVKATSRVRISTVGDDEAADPQMRMGEMVQVGEVLDPHAAAFADQDAQIADGKAGNVTPFPDRSSSTEQPQA